MLVSCSNAEEVLMNQLNCSPFERSHRTSCGKRSQRRWRLASQLQLLSTCAKSTSHWASFTSSASTTATASTRCRSSPKWRKSTTRTKSLRARAKAMLTTTATRLCLSAPLTRAHPRPPPQAFFTTHSSPPRPHLHPSRLLLLR